LCRPCGLKPAGASARPSLSLAGASAQADIDRLGPHRSVLYPERSSGWYLWAFLPVNYGFVGPQGIV